MKRINIFMIFFLFCQILLPGRAFALTLQECVGTALQTHPDLLAAQNKVVTKQAEIKQSHAGTKPQFSAGASYSRTGSGSAKSNKSYDTSVQIEQLVYDFGRTSLRIKSAQVSKEAADADYLAVQKKVIANVRAAYYSLNQHERQNHVAKTRYDNYAKRFRWAESYYGAGTKAKIEVTKAKVDLANAKLAVVKTESAIAQFKAELASAMGQPLRQIDAVDDNLAYQPYDITIEEAIDRAIAHRPELIARQKTDQYAQLNLDYQKKGWEPSVKASAGYGFSGSAPFDDSHWNARLSLSLPLWDGGLTRSKIEAAAAERNVSRAEFDSLRNSVMLEVRKAWQGLYEAKETWTAALAAETQAKETLNLAEERYMAGVGNSLEISDAVESYATAQTETISALYRYKSSQLELEKAMGD
ncbi:Outer membrane protein OprM [Sporomusa rhizae]|uniref:TolC family protein n=1 Tax=Sporomusa rhizae TaxID=357999 RepID=UPI00352B8099